MKVERQTNEAALTTIAVQLERDSSSRSTNASANAMYRVDIRRSALALLLMLALIRLHWIVVVAISSSSFQFHRLVELSALQMDHLFSMPMLFQLVAVSKKKIVSGLRKK